MGGTGRWTGRAREVFSEVRQTYATGEGLMAERGSCSRAKWSDLCSWSMEGKWLFMRLKNGGKILCVRLGNGGNIIIFYAVDKWRKNDCLCRWWMEGNLSFMQLIYKEKWFFMQLRNEGILLFMQLRNGGNIFMHLRNGGKMIVYAVEKWRENYFYAVEKWRKRWIMCPVDTEKCREKIDYLWSWYWGMEKLLSDKMLKVRLQGL